jgi:hypothetical protein
MHTVYGLAAVAGVLAVIFFGFRQGFKVKPRKGNNSTADGNAVLVDNELHRP